MMESTSGERGVFYNKATTILYIHSFLHTVQEGVSKHAHVLDFVRVHEQKVGQDARDEPSGRIRLFDDWFFFSSATHVEIMSSLL